MKLTVYEGHLRNRRQLCGELSVIDGPSREETERAIILKGYRRWGTGFCSRLSGSFAFAILDEDRHALFCARDPFGIEQLYFMTTPRGELICETDINRLASDPRCQKQLDEEALQLYFMFGYPVGIRTLYRGIRKLMPGRYLMSENGTLRQGSFYVPDYRPDRGRSEDEWIRAITDTLSDILSDEAKDTDFSRSASFLSGGVDSAFLLACSGVKRAFGIGYDECEFSEAAAAAQTASALRVRYDELRVTADAFFDELPRYVKSVGLPLADPSSAVFSIGCRRLAGRFDACFSGEGADELFAGYHVYAHSESLGRQEAGAYYGCSGVMKQKAAMRLLGQERAAACETLVEDIYERSAGWDNLSRMQAVDRQLWLEGDILTGVNRAARSSGLRILLPYTDPRMAELAAEIPASLQRKDGCGKYIFRKAAATLLPHEVAFRRKIGFAVPVKRWLEAEGRRERMEAVLFGKTSACFFDPLELAYNWQSFLEGRPAFWQIVYAMYVFVIWYETVFSREADQP